jgi:hypothetical protein
MKHRSEFIQRHYPYLSVSFTRMEERISQAQLAQRRMAGLRHGARSQVVIRRRAGYVKQSILQSSGLKYADLSPIAKRYLDLYSRVEVKIELYDEWASSNGYLDAEGHAPHWAEQYLAAIYTSARLLSKLDQHLLHHRETGPSPLQKHLQEHYIDAEFTEINE